MNQIWGNMMRMMGTEIQEITDKGRTYYKPHPSMETAAYWPDKKTAVFANDSVLKKVFASPGPAGPMAERLRAADTDHDLVVIADIESLPEAMASQIEGARQQVPRPMADLIQIVDHVSSAVLTFDLSGDPLMQLVLKATSSDSAGKIEELAGQGQRMAQQMLAGVSQMIPQANRQQAAPAVQLGQQALSGLQVGRDADVVTITLARPSSMDDVLPKMLADAQRAAGVAAQRSMRLDHLKQIALAMHNHHDAYKAFPPGTIRSSDGTPLLSWRVQLLPFLDEQELYNQFRFDEPWDSQHNIQLVQRIPPVYQTPGRENDGKTSIMVFTGEGTPFGGESGPRLRDIIDGSSNTIMCVEAGPDKATPWTKPEDLPFQPDNPIAALGQLNENVFLAVFLDGAARAFPVDIDARTLRNMITHADRQVVQF
jgi:hypothetical protein